MRVSDVKRNTGGASQSMHAVVATMLLYLLGPWITVFAATAGVDRL